MKSFVYTALEADSNGCNALDAIESRTNLDTAYVQQTNRWYRYFASSTATPNGTTVVIPQDVDPGDPGRWFVQGPPGVSAVTPGQPSALVPNCGGAGTGIGRDTDFTFDNDDELPLTEVFQSVALVALPRPDGALNYGAKASVVVAVSSFGVEPPGAGQLEVQLQYELDNNPNVWVDWTTSRYDLRVLVGGEGSVGVVQCVAYPVFAPLTLGSTLSIIPATTQFAVRARVRITDATNYEAYLPASPNSANQYISISERSPIIPL